MFNENTYLVENLKQRINEIIEENILEVYQCIGNYAYYYESDNGFLRNLDGYKIRQVINKYFSQESLTMNVSTIIDNVFYELETNLLKSGEPLDATTSVNVLTDDIVQSISNEFNKVVERGLNTFKYDFVDDLKSDYFHGVPEEIEYFGGFSDDLLDFRLRLYNRMLDEFESSRRYIINTSTSIVENILSEYTKNIVMDKRKYKDEKIERVCKRIKQRWLLRYRKHKYIFDNDKNLSDNFHRLIKICDDLIEKKGMDNSWLSQQVRSLGSLDDMVSSCLLKKTAEVLDKHLDKIKEERRNDVTEQSELSVNETNSENLDNDRKTDEVTEYNKVYQESLERKKRFEQAYENSQSISKQQKNEVVKVQAEMPKEQSTQPISLESDNVVQTYDDNQPKKVIEDSEVQQQIVQAFKSVQTQKENTQQNIGKSSVDIDIDLDDFAKQEKQILNAKHFTDEQKKRMIQELYDEFDSYVEENPEYHRTR